MNGGLLPGKPVETGFAGVPNLFVNLHQWVAAIANLYIHLHIRWSCLSLCGNDYQRILVNERFCPDTLTDNLQVL
jgi:hypothetical protein